MGVGINLGQVNFSKGVLAPDMHARVDVTSYNAGLKRGENIVVLKRGGFQNRMGTFFIRELPGAGRLFPFEYSIDQTYALAFTQGRMEPFALGGAVLEQDTKITGITNANPAVVTMPYHGYADDDDVYFTGIDGMTEINGRMLKITVIDDNSFSVGVDTTAWGVFSGSTGTLNEVAPPPPPPPPPVPPPPSPPSPPNTGGGNQLCVADDTLILMADGTETQARFVEVGMSVRTRYRSGTGKWGAYRVTAVHSAVAEVYVATIDGHELRATAGHRVWTGGTWRTMQELGEPDGRAWITQLTVAAAHTYISNGILSHNRKVLK